MRENELFSIRVEEPYSADYDKCLDRAAEEKAEKARPKLMEKVENIAYYDIVFLGYPNWLAYHNLIQCTQGFQQTRENQRMDGLKQQKVY